MEADCVDALWIKKDGRLQITEQTLCQVTGGGDKKERGLMSYVLYVGEFHRKLCMNMRICLDEEYLHESQRITRMHKGNKNRMITV